jgi:hypothetical protein
VANLEITINAATVGQSFFSDGKTGRRQDRFLWHGIVELRWDEKTLPIRVEATSAEAENGHLDRERWTKLLGRAAINRARASLLRPFEANDVTYDIPKRATARAASGAVKAAASYLARLNEDYELDQLARRSFTYARQRIRAFAEMPPLAGSSDSDVYAMLAFLQQSLDAGDQGHLYGWNDEKLSGMRSYAQELSTRKNRRHQGFVNAREYILSNINCFELPDAWTRRPPTMNPEILAGAGL